MHSFLLAAAMMIASQMFLPIQTQAATPGPHETLQAAAKAGTLIEPTACARRRVCGPRGCAWRTICR